MRLGIIYKTEDRLIAGTARKLTRDLRASGHKVTSPNSRCRLILTLGGDGTILRAARLSYKFKVPLLTVHMGGLGLLSEITLGEVNAALKAAAQGQCTIDERRLLKVEVRRGKRIIKRGIALNDAVVGKRDIARTIKLEAFLKGRLAGEYVADGLIVATPTGSTAYNYAVGGPILPIHSPAFVISPIAPHRGANRSIILAEPITVRVKKGGVLLTLDGQEIFKLEEGDLLTADLSRESIKFLRLKTYDLWDILRTKLYWG
ncbi:MAG: NAD(+)/NADH kinase [Candidatus Margulisiibacteriota bacterium]